MELAGTVRLLTAKLTVPSPGWVNLVDQVSPAGGFGVIAVRLSTRRPPSICAARVMAVRAACPLVVAGLKKARESREKSTSRVMAARAGAGEPNARPPARRVAVNLRVILCDPPRCVRD